MPAIDNLDWLNANSLRAYPLKEDEPRISVDGIFTLPNDVLVDMQIAASYDITRSFFISKISNLGDSAIFELTDNLGVLAGTFTVVFATHVQYNEYYLVATDSYVGATGIVVINNVADLQNLPSGIFTFVQATTDLETRVIIPALQGINRLIFQNADGTNVSLSGNVEIIARTNIRFKKVDGQNQVIVDAGENINLNTICNEDSGCIKTINGIPPDVEGNFTLAFSDCITLTPIASNTGLMIDDICCKPCMGCNDIAILTERLMVAETALINLREFYTNLSNLYEEYKIVVNYTCNCAS